MNANLKLNFHPVIGYQDTALGPPGDQLLMCHFSIAPKMIDDFYRVPAHTAVFGELLENYLHFRQTHVVVADGPHPERSVQANQIKFFVFEQFPCLAAQITAGIVTIVYGFAILFANIEQAFL